MDRDPPPSYNSVVKGQLRGRDDQQSAGPDRLQADLTTSDRNGEPDRDGHCVEQAVRNTGKPENSDQQQNQRTGIWDRFKKALEDLALFVIQILD